MINGSLSFQECPSNHILNQEDFLNMLCWQMSLTSIQLLRMYVFSQVLERLMVAHMHLPSYRKSPLIMQQ